MIRLLQWLFLGHFHHWKTIDQIPLRIIGSGEAGQRFIQQCDGCGKVVKRDLI